MVRLSVDPAEALVRAALAALAERPAELREPDRRREIDARWYQRARQVGYVRYADRFAGSLPALADKLDHLDELGLTCCCRATNSASATTSRTGSTRRAHRPGLGFVWLIER